MDLDRNELLRIFVDEGEEILAAMEQALVALEKDADEETLAVIFRGAHTLKGGAAALGFRALTEFAHIVEDTLDRVRQRTLVVGSGLITLLLRSVDALRGSIADALAGLEDQRPEHAALLADLAAHASGPVVSKAAGPSAPLPRHLHPRAQELAFERTRTLRVDVAKLDRMLDLTSEIAIARGRLRQALEQRGAAEALEAHRETDRLAFDLQELVMKARMVPVGPTLRHLMRVVRDLAVGRGKAARLILEGEDVEVDTRVIEQLRDPLTHMVRNALDHGIEAPDVRLALGKDPCGSVTLRAYHDAGTIVIELSDDGAGLDRERILERAAARDLLRDGARPSDAEIDALIWEPGFSTAETVTELSGRGVGMDVVRRNIEALRGIVAVASRPGAGTKITIRLPLTLAIIEGFGVGVGDENYVIPMEAVVECVALSEDGTRNRSGGILNLHGRPLPYLRLRDVFGLGVAAGGSRENVVVVKHGDGLAGLAVDILHGESQTVIKALGPLFRGLAGISGSAILGDGRVALILDIPTLFREALGHEALASAEGRRAS